jgi:hypothetical protein
VRSDATPLPSCAPIVNSFYVFDSTCVLGSTKCTVRVCAFVIVTLRTHSLSQLALQRLALSGALTDAIIVGT